MDLIVLTHWGVADEPLGEDFNQTASGLRDLTTVLSTGAPARKTNVNANKQPPRCIAAVVFDCPKRGTRRLRSPGLAGVAVEKPTGPHVGR